MSRSTSVFYDAKIRNLNAAEASVSNATVVSMNAGDIHLQGYIYQDGKPYRMGYNLMSLDPGTETILNPDTQWTVLGNMGIVWAAGVGEASNNSVKQVVVDYSDSVLFAGSYNIGPNSNIMAPGNIGSYIVKCTSDGLPYWIAGLDGINISLPQTIVTDTSNNVYYAGSYSNGAPLIYNANDQLLSNVVNNTSSANNNTFAVKYDQDGSIKWVVSLGANSSKVTASSIIVDDFQNLYLSGSYSGSNPLVFNSNLANPVGSNILPAPTASSQVAYTIKFNSSGSAQYATTINGSDANVLINTSAADTQNYLYVAGQYTGSAPVASSTGSNTVTLRTPSASTSGYILKYSSNGVPVWAATIDTPNGVYVTSVATDTSNNLYAVGYYNNAAIPPVFYNGTTGLASSNSKVPAFSNSTRQAAFLAKYSCNGDLNWVSSINGDADDTTKNVCLAGNGNIYVCGKINNGSLPPIIYDIDGKVSAVSLQTTSQTSNANFVIVYNQAGSPVDAILVNTGSNTSGPAVDAVNKIAVDYSGNIYFAGGFENTVPTFYSNRLSEAKSINIGESSNPAGYITKYTLSNQYKFILESTLPSDRAGHQKYITNTGTGPASVVVKTSSASSPEQFVIDLEPGQSTLLAWNNRWMRLV